MPILGSSQVANLLPTLRIGANRTTSMRILAIETSSPPGSIALSIEGQIRIQRFATARRTTETFAVSIQELLSEVQLKPSDIDLVATTLGPGSFTGLRIGITAAKVFAHATSARIVATNTLELVARQLEICDVDKLQGSAREIEVVIDAQRGELFAARFRIDEERVETVHPTKIVSADEWIASRARDATLTGTGLRKIRDRLPTGAIVADEELWQPSAEHLARIAEGKLADGESDPMTLVPRYFRRSAAEEKADRV